jgi:uncharacterized protein YggE
MNAKSSFWAAWGPTVATVVVLFALLAVTLFGALPRVLGQATTPPATAGQLRTITVVGEGVVKVKPDTAVASIGVETLGDTVRQATTQNAETMTAIMAALKAQGVADADIQTSGFNVWLDRQSPSPEVKGMGTPVYHVNNNVSVTIRDLTKVGAVLDAVIEAGANSIYGVSFGLDDPKPLMVQARGKAVADALAKADELAGLNKVEVGQVLSVSEIVAGGGGYYPSAMAYEINAGKGGAGGVGPITAGELEIRAQLQVVYAIQ